MKTRSKLLAILLILFFATPAFAHPHIFINYRADCTFDNNKLKTLDFTLEFDKVYSSDRILDYDDNQDEKLSKKELAVMLKDFDYMFKRQSYYLGIEQAGAPVIIDTPKLIEAYYKNKILHIKMQLKTDIDLDLILEKPLEIFLADKTNMVAFTPMVEDEFKPKAIFTGDKQKFILATKIILDPDTLLIKSKKIDLSKITKQATTPKKSGTAKDSNAPKTSDPSKTVDNPQTVTTSETFEITNAPTRKHTFFDKIKKLQAEYNKYCKNKIYDIAQSITPLTVVLIFVFSILLGFVHAAAPGHGKSIAVAYFSNRHAKWYQPFVFGFTVAGAHTGIALLISFVIYLATKKSASNNMDLINNINFGIAIFFFAVSIFMIVDAFRTARGKAHHHDEADAVKPGRGLFKVAIVGGIIPCPLSLMILSFLMAMNLYYLGVIAVLGIAIGTGLLISVAGLVVWLGRKKLLDRLDAESPMRSRINIFTKFFAAILIFILSIGLFTLYTPTSILNTIFPNEKNTNNAVKLNKPKKTATSSSKDNNSQQVTPAKGAAKDSDKKDTSKTKGKVIESEHDSSEAKPADPADQFNDEDEII